MALTEEAERVAGIPYVTDDYRQEAEKILEGESFQVCETLHAGPADAGPVPPPGMPDTSTVHEPQREDDPSRNGLRRLETP